jgi:beta-hydroxylase
MKTSATQNVDGEPVGFLNRVFVYAYKGRLWGKALKKRSRVGYYALKWSLLAGLVVLVFV